MRKLRHLGSLLLVLGGLSLGAATLATPASATAPVYNASLKAVHVGSTNPGFTTGDCPSEGWGWHFVLPGNTSNFVFVKATFQNEGVVTAFVSSPTAKHAYVFTSGPDTLLGAVAQVTGTDDEFVLSHVCTGPAVTTTTAPQTSTTEAVTTTTAPQTSTTEAETTTTAPQTSTTEAETTTTEAETTTTEAETTTTEAATTTTEAETTTTEGPEVLGTSTIAETSSTTEPAVVLSESTKVPATTTTTTPVVAANRSLPRTGSSSKTLATTGMALVLFGGVLLLRSRRLGQA